MPGHATADDQMGQLIALLRGYAPSNPVNRRLGIVAVEGGLLATTGVDVPGTVWRWIRGFHAAFAHIVKTRTEAGNVDRIVSNKGAMSYSCVWGRPVPSGPWLCAFGLDVYDWKDLGEPPIQQRDCLGFYVQDERPNGAAVERRPTM
jgi:hypothetical protein